MWSTDLDVVLTLDGVDIGAPMSASWSHGRGDWFAGIAPGSASFTYEGDFGALHNPGEDMVLTVDGTTVWSGKVDSISLSQDPAHTTTTFSGADLIAQLGEARLWQEALFANRLESQLDTVFAMVGLNPTITTMPSLQDTPTLGAVADLSTSLLDWLTQAESESNAIIQVTPEGDIEVQMRGALPDYGQRVMATHGWAGNVAATSLWRMGESSGNLADTGGVVTGTAAGTPNYGQEGPWGPSGPDAIRFAKTDAADRFTFGDNYDLTSSNWAMSGWVRPNTVTSDNPIWAKQAAGPSGWQLRTTTTGALQFFAYNAGTLVVNVATAAGACPILTWTHWAVVKISTTVYLVVNGTILAQGTTVGSIPNTSATLTMGTDGGSLWFGGDMTMMSFWTVALSDVQLEALIDFGAVQATGVMAPSTWTNARSITSVINHWVFRWSSGGDITEDHPTSRAAYGRRTFELSTDALSSPTDTFDSDLRTVMENPRSIINATFHVTGDESAELVGLAPLDFLQWGPTLWQVLAVSHDLTPDEWSLSLTLDRHLNDMHGAAPVLPV